MTGTMRDLAASYDHVIVGGGSAGCVLANRLSADPKRRILLVEAGGADRSPWIHVPLGYGKLFGRGDVNWGYLSDPEPFLDGRRIAQPRGRVLGGSSSINGLLYVRGQREDFDGWRDAGCVGWGHDDVLPYFIRSEDQQRGADDWHGVGGPLAVSDQTEPHELCEAFLAAGERLGQPLNPDFNGARQEGFGYYQVTARRGLRCSTAVGYLRPARTRRNLHVMTGALVQRVLFEQGRAVGIAGMRGDQPFTVGSQGDVILAAGAINTPHLLQLSGIGAGGLLARHGIEVLADRPEVGQNFQDHLQVRHVFRARRPMTINDDLASIPGRLRVAWRFARHRAGPLTISAGYAGAFMRSLPELERPDIQLLLINFSNSRKSTELDPFSGFTMSVCPLRPRSRGAVTITSADPRVHPSICANFLADEDDRRVVLRGMRAIRAVSATPEMAALIEAEELPGATAESDADLLDHARRHGSTLYHASCTARMGSDAGAVVDPLLRVNGVGNLRVADASVMPAVVSGNTLAATVMIAEKASDLVLAG